MMALPHLSNNLMLQGCQQLHLCSKAVLHRLSSWFLAGVSPLSCMAWVLKLAAQGPGGHRAALAALLPDLTTVLRQLPKRRCIGGSAWWGGIRV